MITLAGAGAIIKDKNDCIFMVKIQRRDMLRWELPTGVREKGESIFLTLYRCVSDDSSSQLNVRIGRPICLGLNISTQLEHQYFAMFFECKAEFCSVKLLKEANVNLPNEARQKIVDAKFIDWRQLPPNEIHPQHQKILSQWSQSPDGPIFQVISDADSERKLYEKMCSEDLLSLNKSVVLSKDKPKKTLHTEISKQEITNQINTSADNISSLHSGTGNIINISMQPPNTNNITKHRLIPLDILYTIDINTSLDYVKEILNSPNKIFSSVKPFFSNTEVMTTVWSYQCSNASLQIESDNGKTVNVVTLQVNRSSLLEGFEIPYSKSIGELTLENVIDENSTQKSKYISNIRDTCYAIESYKGRLGGYLTYTFGCSGLSKLITAKVDDNKFFDKDGIQIDISTILVNFVSISKEPKRGHPISNGM